MRATSIYLVLFALSLAACVSSGIDGPASATGPTGQASIETLDLAVLGGAKILFTRTTTSGGMRGTFLEPVMN